jgi:hypothetical protein
LGLKSNAGRTDRRLVQIDTKSWGITVIKSLAINCNGLGTAPTTMSFPSNLSSER